MIYLRNIQDSIANTQPEVTLQPLYEPEAVKFTFSTVGWKILGVVMAILFLMLLYKAVKNYIKNANRRKALALMQQSPAPQTIFVLLKQLAIEAYGRKQVSTLYGKQWLGFLDETGKGVHFSNLETDIHALVYKNETASDTIKKQVQQNAIQWIKTYAR
ncbi:MAG: DUF4381 domain-containing protein [Flavobacteriaceae bacterium]